GERQAKSRKEQTTVSLVGYTNSGKSTLMNRLTDAGVLVEDKLFATLDPTSRRLRFPRDMEVVITDTVGFIKQLPAELLQAFKATLEELEEADLLVHVIDLSNPCFRDQMKVVDDLLRELDLNGIPCLKLFNKADQVKDDEILLADVAREGVVASAINIKTLAPFLEKAQSMMGKIIQN
ncbi:MAG: 50S ribosome-binding GTPase, partial [Desulfocapsa sp.]|nr:50S ribosome-binding GTPase [Desulfocapsa sp.]